MSMSKSLAFLLKAANATDPSVLKNLSNKLNDLKARQSTLKVGDEIDFGGGIKLKYKETTPTGELILQSSDGKVTGTLDEIIKDLSLPIDIAPNGVVRSVDIPPGRVQELKTKFEAQGASPGQANVMAQSELTRAKTSPLAQEAKTNTLADNAAPDRQKVGDAEQKQIQDSKPDLEEKVDLASYDPNRLANPNNRPRPNLSSVTQQATGNREPIVSIQRQLGRKNLLDTGGQLAKNAEASSGLSSTVKKWFKRLGKLIAALAVLGFLAGLDDIIEACTEATLAAAADDHQKDLNGCWLIDTIQGTETKVKLLTCGHYDVSAAMETCATQVYTGANAATITKCPDTTFNPCAKTSTSRTSDKSVPLVPNVCDLYLYNGTAPLAVTGVTVKNACLNTDGTSLKDTQACSPYCSTQNFDLPSHLQLVCRSVEYPFAFAHLLANVGVNPVEVFPPAAPPKDTGTVSAAKTAASKPLLIATAVLGGIFLILLVIFFVL